MAWPHTVYRLSAVRYPDLPHFRHGRFMGFKKAVAHPDLINPWWVLGLLTKGSLALQVGRDKALLKPGDFYLLVKNAAVHGQTSGYEGIWIAFDATGRRLKHIENKDGIVLPVFGRAPPQMNYLHWYKLFKYAVEVDLMNRVQIAIQISAMLSQFCVEFRRDRIRMDPSSAIAYDVMRYLVNHYPERIDSTVLVGAFHYSYGHLERVFRACFGCSIRHRLTVIRIDESIGLLVEGRSMKETARLVGFGDYYYFLKTFKKIKGVTPTELLDALGR